MISEVKKSLTRKRETLMKKERNDLLLENLRSFHPWSITSTGVNLSKRREY